jgi:outer membrane protein TolC
MSPALPLIASGLLLAAAPQQTAPSAPAARLSFLQAVAQALERNDRLVDQREGVVRAQLGLKLARSAFHPKVVPNVLGSFGQTDVSNQTYRLDLVQKLTTGTEVRASVGTSSAQNQLGSFYNTDSTIQLGQPLLRGFGRSVARRGLTSAEARLADAARQRRLVEQQVVLDVASAYYRLVAQGHLVLVAEKGGERARRLLEASTAKMEIGRVSQLDVYRAQQLAAQAEAQLLDARGGVEDAREQLLFLIGRGPEYAFEVEPEIPREIETLAPEAAASVALERRLELEGARAAIADAELGAAYARNQLLPQLDLNLALTRRETADSFASSFRFDHFRFATFFAVSLPSDRTAQTIELQNAVLERDRRQRELETLKRRIADEARRTLRRQARLLKTLELADSSVDFARKEAEVAELRYQRGLSNNLDVVNAENNLLAAESRRIAVLADLAVARLTLHATLGLLDPWALLGDSKEREEPVRRGAGD